MSERSRKYAERCEKVVPPAQQKLEQNLQSQLGDRVFRLPDLAWEFGLCFGLKRDTSKEVFRRLRDDESFLFNMFIDVTAVDWLERREPRFDVVYQLLSLTHNHRLCLKIEVSEDSPEVESVADLWAAANFLEREVWDMYGISFKGHPNQKRILMYDEFVGHPLRKDYPVRGKQPRVPLRIPELRNTSQDMRKEELVSLPTRRRVLPAGGPHA